VLHVVSSSVFKEILLAVSLVRFLPGPAHFAVGERDINSSFVLMSVWPWTFCISFEKKNIFLFMLLSSLSVLPLLIRNKLLGRFRSSTAQWINHKYC
jgi:hypothetical protein